MPASISTIEKPVASINLRQSLAYALPSMAVAFLVGPLSILQGVYAKYYSLPLNEIATVLLVSRLFDALTDPLIGYLSDRCWVRWGTRKPFVIAGGVLLVISGYFLYVPTGFDNYDLSENVSATYFLCWFLVFYFAFTLFEIPHLAWAGETATHSQHKTRMYGLRTGAMFLGTLLFFAVPLLPIFETNAFTPETLGWSVIIAGIMMVPMLYICITQVPNKMSNHACITSAGTRIKKGHLSELLSSILKNIPFQLFLAAFFFTGVGVGMWFSLLFLFVDSYLGLGQSFSFIYVAGFSVSTISLMGWIWLSNCLNKTIVWVLAILLIALGFTGTGLMNPRDTGEITLLICITMISSGSAAVIVMAQSMLADIIDYGTWQSGSDRSGSYFSLYTLVTKANVAIGGALGFMTAGAYGFDPTAATQNVSTSFGMHLAIAWLPAAIVLLSIPFVLSIPINARRHSIINRRLHA